MGKRALAVISFGTSYQEAEKAIVNIEETCKRAFPHHDFFRAFTSTIIIKKLKKVKDIHIMYPDQLFQMLYDEGYDEVLVQTTHIIKGHEYHKLLDLLAPWMDKFSSLKAGQPLLSSENDYTNTAEIIIRQLPDLLQEKEAFLLMGHGTDHKANSSYDKMNEKFLQVIGDRVMVATVEGSMPIDAVIPQLKKKGIEKVYTMPMMVVAGDHARNDLAGDEDDSWKSILEKEGMQVEVIMKGLGEIDAVAELFLDHLRQAEMGLA